MILIAGFRDFDIGILGYWDIEILGYLDIGELERWKRRMMVLL